jgi:16S rRNA (adenine1518-N6/adenine1519-N6)-dimethyltransferase
MNNRGFHPRKSLGQHFLKNPKALGRIVQEAGLTMDDLVLEIGPGTGNLTRLIDKKTQKWWALEKDKQLCARLREEFPSLIIEGDARCFDYHTLPFPTDKKLKLLGNLPYNAANEILLHLIPYRNLFSVVVCMVQEEVADRLTANHGTKSYGVLSVTIQLYFRVEKLFNVPSGDFFPPPKVTSSVVRLQSHEKPQWDIPDETLFFQLVKAAFSQRRNTLANALTGFHGLPRRDIIRFLQTSDIDPSRRGESLSIEEYAHLTRRFLQTRSLD